MSYSLDPISVAGLTVGTTKTVVFGQYFEGVILDPNSSLPPRLQIFNESGMGLLIRLGAGSFRLPAGGWREVTLADMDRSFTYTIEYVLANAPVSNLSVDFYAQGEPSPPVGQLGNSPIGLSSITLPVTQVIQDSQPSGQTIVESTPTGLTQTILMTTDGKLILGPNLAAPGNAPELIGVVPVGGTVNNMWGLLYNGPDGTLLFNDITHSKNILVINPNAGINIPSGAIAGINGQATAGSFGVPVIVAQALHVNVTVTTQQTILSYTPPVTGLYRVSLYGAVKNNGAVVTLGVSYTDPDFGAIGAATPVTPHAVGVSPFTPISAFSTSATVLITQPMVIYASSTAAIVVKYQNSGTTPNDFVDALIERLA